MITNTVSIEIVDSPDQAPKYEKDFTLLKMQKCIVVGKGTVNGNPTIDIQLTDENGNKFLIMATGGIIEMISGAIAGKRIRGYN